VGLEERNTGSAESATERVVWVVLGMAVTGGILLGMVMFLAVMR